MVTRDTSYITTDIFLDVVVKREFPLLSLVLHLFNVVSGNKYITRGSMEIFLAILPLVMYLLPDRYYL